MGVAGCGLNGLPVVVIIVILVLFFLNFVDTCQCYWPLGWAAL